MNRNKLRSYILTVQQNIYHSFFFQFRIMFPHMRIIPLNEKFSVFSTFSSYNAVSSFIRVYLKNILHFYIIFIQQTSKGFWQCFIFFSSKILEGFPSKGTLTSFFDALDNASASISLCKAIKSFNDGYVHKHS